MSETMITADEAAAPAETNELLIELPAGVDEASDLRGVKIKDVKLKGMRNRPVMLLRVPSEDIVKMDP
jgi:hypothetical protein